MLKGGVLAVALLASLPLAAVWATVVIDDRDVVEGNVITTASSPTTPGEIDTVAIDADPFTTTTNTGTALGPIDECTQVAAAASFSIDVTVNSVDLSTPLAGYGFDVIFDPTIIQLGLDNDADNTARTSDALDNDGDGKTDEPGEGYDEDPSESSPPFGVDNDGDTAVDEDGISHTHVKLPAAADFTFFPQQDAPALTGGGGRYRIDGGAFSGFSSGVGAVVRIPVKAVGSGISPLDLTDTTGGDGIPDFFDASASPQTVNNTVDGRIAVGEGCPAPATPTTSLEAIDRRGGDGSGLTGAEAGAESESYRKGRKKQ